LWSLATPLQPFRIECFLTGAKYFNEHASVSSSGPALEPEELTQWMALPLQ
jgi:hypothetical protein